jgi:tRNA pseudouridine55 synthase
MTNNIGTDILNINKPAGPTSYAVVREIKKRLNLKKVGHGGTLDPFAEGVLLILVGNATKRMNELLKLSKTYEAILQLGVATDTGDPTGQVIATAEVPPISPLDLFRVQQKFVGTIDQKPHPYSAKKINGQPAYRLARQGLEPSLKSRPVWIGELILTLLDPSQLKIQVSCSSGTYIRVLGEDIARELGTAGHLITLKRTRIGPYRVQDALTLEQLPVVLQNNEISKGIGAS